jgi:hypothetical protein
MKTTFQLFVSLCFTVLGFARGPLINVSTKSLVGPGAEMTSGFVIRSGTGEMKMLIRAVGPTLAADPFKVANVLKNLKLTIFNSEGREVAVNTGWDQIPTDGAEIQKAALVTGAFQLLPKSNDCAIVISLPTGNWTAQITSTDGSLGLALIEIYEIPEINPISLIPKA